VDVAVAEWLSVDEVGGFEGSLFIVDGLASMLMMCLVSLSAS
jgi:hypothetical protein